MRISGITYVHRKKHRTRTAFFVLIILVLAAFISTALISAYAAWKLTHPERQPVPSFSSDMVTLYKDISFQDINNKVQLKGWLFEAENSNKAVVLAHGCGKSRLQFGDKTLDMVKGLLNKGYSVLAFDFRGSGISEKNSSTFGMYEKYDLLGAVNYAKSQGAEFIAVLGFDTGASASLMAAAERNHGSIINAVIADTPYASLKHHMDKVIPEASGLPSIPFNHTILLAARLLSGLDTEKANPLSILDSIPSIPVMFIHSNADKTTPFEDTLSLYSKYQNVSKNEALLWETHEARHSDSYLKQPDLYLLKVLSFLDSVVTEK